MTPQRSPDVPPSPKRRHRPSSSSAASGIQMPSTAGAVVSLPDEIIFDILTRVPVNSACRFRCVSHEWRALISSPDFVAAHKSRHAEPLVAVYSFREEPSKGTELRLVDMDGNVVRVIKVKDGLGSSKLPHHDLLCITNDNSDACLVDPATGEVLVTCPCPRPRPKSLVMCFGRAVPSGAYKALCFVRGDERFHHYSERRRRMETDAAEPNQGRVPPGLRDHRERNPPHLGDG
nr:F-box protein At3g49450-like [Aegilops tauschii subsp. strangulata]